MSCCLTARKVWLKGVNNRLSWKKWLLQPTALVWTAALTQTVKRFIESFMMCVFSGLGCAPCHQTCMNKTRPGVGSIVLFTLHSCHSQIEEYWTSGFWKCFCAQLVKGLTRYYSFTSNILALNSRRCRYQSDISTRWMIPTSLLIFQCRVLEKLRQVMLLKQ